ncbi:hypothetical protein B0H14DRAFT_2647482 [Mycena olivaceomarginata]|nr:hypothetical protein B0H14DRAFT_2647482 [Mycena olivaceomarginata]
MAQPQPRQNPLLEGAQGSRASLASAMNRARCQRCVIVQRRTAALRREESEEEGDAGADSDVENVLRPPTPPPSGRGGGGASNTLTSNARGGTPPTAYSRLDPAPSASPDTLVHRALSSPPSNHDFTAQSPPSTPIRQELPRQTPPGRQSPPPSPPSPPRTAASSFSSARSRDRDICYACGLSGHWAQDCPSDRGSPSPDISPSFRRVSRPGRSEPKIFATSATDPVTGHRFEIQTAELAEFNVYTVDCPSRTPHTRAQDICYRVVRCIWPLGTDCPSSPGSSNRIYLQPKHSGQEYLLQVTRSAVKMGTGQKLAEPDDHFSSLVSCLLYIAPLLRPPKNTEGKKKKKKKVSEIQVSHHSVQIVSEVARRPELEHPS